MNATATAHPNIALIKYWGKRNIALNLPAVPSLSVTLDSFSTKTTVQWGSHEDSLTINGTRHTGQPLSRVQRFLDLIDSQRPRVCVTSENNFPTAAGLASSSSAFAALAMAATAAAGQSLNPQQLSVLARRGSGSACRSLWGGWVLWPMGCRPDGNDCHGQPIAPENHWDVKMVVALVTTTPKKIGSTQGMLRTQDTSALYPGWIDTAQSDITDAIAAIKHRDLERLGTAMERSTLKMHATMISCGVRYWQPETVALLDRVEALRDHGIGAWYTMDAGPNVKVLCATKDAEKVSLALKEITPNTHTLGVGHDARLC